MDSWVEITVRVPVRLVGAAYEAVGRVIREDADSAANIAVARRGEAWRTGTNEELMRDAKALYREIAPLTRRVLDYWLDRNGERVRAADVVRDLGLDSTRVLSGTLSSFGKRERKAKREGRTEGQRGLPFFWEEAHDGTWYWMDPEVAALFRHARTEIGQ